MHFCYFWHRACRFQGNRLVFSMGDYFYLEWLIWLALFIHFSKLMVHIFNVRLLQTASASEKRELCLGHCASTVLAVCLSTYLHTHLVCLSLGKKPVLRNSAFCSKTCTILFWASRSWKINKNKHCALLRDNSFSFKPHIDNLVKKLKLKLDFFFLK